MLILHKLFLFLQVTLIRYKISKRVGTAEHHAWAFRRGPGLMQGAGLVSAVQTQFEISLSLVSALTEICLSLFLLRSTGYSLSGYGYIEPHHRPVYLDLVLFFFCPRPLHVRLGPSMATGGTTAVAEGAGHPPHRCYIYLLSLAQGWQGMHLQQVLASERNEHISPCACFTIPVHFEPCTPPSLHMVAISGPSVIKLKVIATMCSLISGEMTLRIWTTGPLSYFLKIQSHNKGWEGPIRALLGPILSKVLALP